MPRALRRFGILLAQTAEKCQRDNTPMLAAGLSFYTMLSVAPALWIVVAAAGAIVGRDSAHAAVLGWMGRNIGANAALYLSDIIDQVNESSRLATIGGGIAMFLGATAAFGALQDSLNRIWHQPDSSDAGILAILKGFTRGFVTRRVLAFVIMLLLGGLLLVSLLASAALTFIARYVPADLPAPNFLLQAADFVVSILLVMLLFGTVCHMLHRKAFSRVGIWTGAALSAILFAIGKSLIGLYLGSSGLRSAYGAAGSFVLLLLWIYYSTQILLFGAEFTEVYSRHRAAQNDRPLQ